MVLFTEPYFQTWEKEREPPEVETGVETETLSVTFLGSGVRDKSYYWLLRSDGEPRVLKVTFLNLVGPV